MGRRENRGSESKATTFAKKVADTVPDKQIETMHIFMDENINIGFLEIERKN